MSNLENKVMTNMTLYADDASRNSPPSIYAKQYDARSRFIKVKLMQASGEITVNGLAQLNCTKPSGQLVYSAGTVNDDGTITFELTSNMLTDIGRVSCDVSIFSTEDSSQILLTSSTFGIIVEKTNYDQNAIEGFDEFSTVSDVLMQAAETKGEIEDLKEDIDEGILLKGDGLEMSENMLYLTSGNTRLTEGISFEPDATLTQSGEPGDAKATGDAIEDINKRLGTTIEGWVDGQYINTAGAIGSVVDINTTGTDNTRFVVLDCSEGEIFTVSGRGGTSARLWCFLDSENQIVSSSGPRAICSNYVLTAPSGSAKLIIQQVITDATDCYIGVSPFEEETVHNPMYPYRTIEAGWEKGGIDGNGFFSSTSNIRTKGIYINPGETFVVTNTSQTHDMALYACKDNGYVLVGSGYQIGVGQLIADDPKYCYYIRVKRHSNSSSIATSEGNNFVIEIRNDAYKYRRPYLQRYVDYVGFNRTYTYLNPMLTFENKDLESDGTLSDSTTRCIAQLPRNGCVEVKQQMYGRCFKVAKVTTNTVTEEVGNNTVTTVTKDVTYLVNDWSYYTCRYIGDAVSDYYVIVAASNSLSSEITPESASNGIAAYSYTDEGVRTEDRWMLSLKKIAVIGDSITQGRFAKYGTSLNWTASKPFGELIAEQAGDDDYGNFGIGGALVYNSDWKSLYANCGKVSGYDVVFVCGGTNDYGNNVSEANFIAAYTYVIETLMANNTEVVVCTPVYRESKTGANTQSLTLYDYGVIEMNIATAKGIKAIDLYKLTNNQKFIKYLPDGLHPNEIGHQIIANHILNEYQRLSV